MTSSEEPPNPWSREAQSGEWPAPDQHQPPPPPHYPQQPVAPPPQPRRRRAALWVGFGVLMALIVGAAIWGAIAETRSHDNSSATPSTGARQTSAGGGQTTVVTARDRKSQLTVPVSWKDVPTSLRNDLAVIQLGDLRREQYVIVITMDHNDFEDFDAFAAASVDGAKQVLDGPEVSQPRNLTIGGLPAVQYEITGKTQGVKIAFWYTMVAGKNAFYQVVTWTLPSRRTEAEPTITEVVNSFRELGPS